jgi:hypothetical protein
MTQWHDNIANKPTTEIRSLSTEIPIRPTAHDTPRSLFLHLTVGPIGRVDASRHPTRWAAHYLDYPPASQVEDSRASGMPKITLGMHACPGPEFHFEVSVSRLRSSVVQRTTCGTYSAPEYVQFVRKQ